MWVECDWNKACLVQGANKRVQRLAYFYPNCRWVDVDNNLPYYGNSATQMRFRYDSRDYPTEHPKGRPDLFPAMALQLAGEVLAFGEKKYPNEEWKRMSSEEHIAASMRHLLEHLSGNLNDSESLKLHLAHSLVRLGMALEQHITQR